MKGSAVVAALLCIFVGFQKRLQHDATTLVDMQTAVTDIQSRVVDMKQKRLRGWRETFEASIVKSDEEFILKG